MVSRKILLTAKRIETLSVPTQYGDTKCPGLVFQISREEGRSFIFRYSLNGRDRQYDMWPVDHFRNVEEARDEAWRLTNNQSTGAEHQQFVIERERARLLDERHP